MWLMLVNFFLRFVGNSVIQKLGSSLLSQLADGAADLVPEAIGLMKEAAKDSTLSGFDKLGYVATKMHEAHKDMAMSVITNIVTSAYDAYKNEIKV
jgi:hypothetical protein